MNKLIFSVLLISSLNTLAADRAPISGDCEIAGETKGLEFPTGSGSLFPAFKDGTSLSVFAGPSENLAKDEKGVNLFDITIDSSDQMGESLGTVIFRHLTASPSLIREFSFELRNGTVVNCKF